MVQVPLCDNGNFGVDAELWASRVIAHKIISFAFRAARWNHCDWGLGHEPLWTRIEDQSAEFHAPQTCPSWNFQALAWLYDVSLAALYSRSQWLGNRRSSLQLVIAVVAEVVAAAYPIRGWSGKRGLLKHALLLLLLLPPWMLLASCINPWYNTHAHKLQLALQLQFGACDMETAWTTFCAHTAHRTIRG